jgi:DNA-binding response OmpR family regulator
MSKIPILVVEDDEAIGLVLVETLVRSGFSVTIATDARSAFDQIRQELPLLIILDVRLPGISGLELLRQLRSSDGPANLVPVILVTGESSEPDRILGLELGADDYVTKPFSPNELAARVRSVLRRATRSQDEAFSTLQRGRLIIDSDRHTATYAGKPVPLTATEFRIVHVLASQDGKLLSRAAIHEAVHGTPALPDDRAIDAHIKTIRRKLDTGGDEIETVRGVGYRWR